MTDRKLSRYGGGLEEESVTKRTGAGEQYGDPVEEEDRPVPDDVDPIDDDPVCSECDRAAAYEDPSESLGTDSLPAVPLCRHHILEHK